MDAAITRAAPGRAPRGPGRDRLRLPVHSIGWWAMAGGSRPASSQPMAIAMSGMPTTMNRRSPMGALARAPTPPFNALPRNQAMLAT